MVMLTLVIMPRLILPDSPHIWVALLYIFCYQGHSCKMDACWCSIVSRNTLLLKCTCIWCLRNLFCFEELIFVCFLLQPNTAFRNKIEGRLCVSSQCITNRHSLSDLVGVSPCNWSPADIPNRMAFYSHNWMKLNGPWWGNWETCSWHNNTLCRHVELCLLILLTLGCEFFFS